MLRLPHAVPIWRHVTFQRHGIPALMVLCSAIPTWLVVGWVMPGSRRIARILCQNLRTRPAQIRDAGYPTRRHALGRGHGASILLGVERPLGVAARERKLHRGSDREGEATGAGLQEIGRAHV